MAGKKSSGRGQHVGHYQRYDKRPYRYATNPGRSQDSGDPTMTRGASGSGNPARASAVSASSRRPAGLAMIVTALTALVASACSGAPPRANLPTNSPEPTTAAPSSPSPTPNMRQQVISSYLAYWKAGAAA